MIEGRILAILVRDDAERLFTDAKALRLTVYLISLALEGIIPLHGDLMNPRLVYHAFRGMYDVALGVEGACGVPTRAAITCVTIAARQCGLFLQDAQGHEVGIGTPPVDSLVAKFGLKDAFVLELRLDMQRYQALAARPGGEKRIFDAIVTGGIFRDEFVGAEGAVLEKLVVRNELGKADDLCGNQPVTSRGRHRVDGVGHVGFRAGRRLSFALPEHAPRASLGRGAFGGLRGGFPPPPQRRRARRCRGAGVASDD